MIVSFLVGPVQISDPAKILPIIDEVMARNPDNVAKFKAEERGQRKGAGH